MIVGYYKNYLYTTDISSAKKKKIQKKSPSIWLRTPKPVRIRQSGRTGIGGVTFFVREFQTKYVTVDYKETKWEQFLNIRQGNLTVVEYEKEFSRLSKYAL